MINYQRESLCTHVSVFVSLLTCLFVYSIFYLHNSFLLSFTNMYVTLPDSLFVCLFSGLSVCLSMCLSLCLSVCLCAASDSCGSRVWHSWCHQLTGAAPPGMNTASASLHRLHHVHHLHHCITASLASLCY